MTRGRGEEKFEICVYTSISIKESRPMGAAILNFSFGIARKLLFLSSPPLAHDLLYFRKATGGLRGGQYPVLCFVLAFFLKIVTSQKVCSLCARKPLHFLASSLARGLFSVWNSNW